jgi:hypothetical protein
MRNAMTMIMASGTPSSYCSQVKPPPVFSATKAGMEIKLMADVWVAIVDMPTDHHDSLRPPTK